MTLSKEVSCLRSVLTLYDHGRFQPPFSLLVCHHPSNSVLTDVFCLFLSVEDEDDPNRRQESQDSDCTCRFGVLFDLPYCLFRKWMF